jgi:hypothetical protein
VGLCSIGRPSLLIYTYVYTADIRPSASNLGSQILGLLQGGLYSLLSNFRTSMDYHWLCSGVIISAVVAGQSKPSRDIMDRAYILMACNKYPPPPEVVIKGWVRPGSTCACRSKR